MGAKYLLDSNFIINYLQGRDWAAGFLENLCTPELFVSVITEMELLAFSRITAQEEYLAKRFLEQVRIIPLNEAVKNEAIRLRRIFRLKLPDAIVVATGLVLGASLVTSDHRLSTVPLPNLQIIIPDS